MDLTWRVSCLVQTRDLNHWKGPLGISHHCPVYGWTRGNGCELRRNSPIAMLVWENSGDYVGRKTLVVNAIDGGAKMETAVVEKPMLEFQMFAGSPMPFGATAQDGGYNFSVYTSNADLYETVISRGEYGALGPGDNCWPQMAGMVPSSDNELIAEAWDTGGLYQVGTFPHGGIWSEWNGQYCDIVRQFIKGTDGFSGAFAECLCGSPNLYQDTGSMCDPCNGKGWLVCDFCKGQKINVKAENNRIYRRCPSCRAIGYVLCSKCKVFKCVTFPDYSDGKL